MAHASAREQEDDHGTRDEPDRAGRDAHHRRPDKGYEHPHSDSDEARGPDASHPRRMVRMLVRPFQLLIQEAQGPLVMLVPASGKEHGSVYGASLSSGQLDLTFVAPEGGPLNPLSGAQKPHGHVDPVRAESDDQATREL